ncbi:TIGR01777 family oxidoreductase [uncultured Microbacterium sp.]|uniref:TIGR01777 family oxidoreductase n=1 Tax=uncultured Microbacterium sp. TaxID=191216 RepID=UPI0025E553AE|nr:TIGR01777 family oxidoreductase [uncultured Microbacterium sp.]
MSDFSARRVVLAGASGLIGRALAESLRGDGVEVHTLVRRAPQHPTEHAWDPYRGPLDPAVLAGASAVVALNGASIGHLPWTPRYRSELVWSRLTPTRVLAEAVAHAEGTPAFVSASATGFYGAFPGETVDERSPGGAGFLADLCREWESTAERASAGGSRVALLRTAPVVHPEGVLKPLIALTRAGVAGPLSSGRQVWPWISLDDEVRAIRHVIDHEIAGPVNLTGPTRATQNDLGFAVAMRLQKPYLVRAPKLGLKLLLGRTFADDVLLTDAHVVPAVLNETGFTFRHPTVSDAVSAAIPARD